MQQNTELFVLSISNTYLEAIVKIITQEPIPLDSWYCWKLF